MSDPKRPSVLSAATVLPRVVTAVIYGAVVIGALALDSLWDRPYATGVVTGVMAGFAAREFFALERRESRASIELLGIVAAAVMPLAAALWGLPGLTSVVTALIAASLVWHTALLKIRTVDTALTLFGAVYTGFLLAYLVLVRSLDAGLILSLALVVSVWVNDVFAYFIGSLLGRHRMAPQISPKKSWEGFAAGALASLTVWAVLPLYPASGLNWVQALTTGVAVALFSTVGDLAESRMKREAGVKDSGHSLPGHGGFLDRLDSLIMVCLVAYWVLTWGGVR